MNSLKCGPANRDATPAPYYQVNVPVGEIKDLILTVTYVIVIFSVLLQGSTVGLVAKHYAGETGLKDEKKNHGH